MIDTIKLVIDYPNFVVKTSNLFMKDKYVKGRGYFTLVFNPTKKDFNKHGYLPRAVVTNRFNSRGVHGNTLTIELSLPKLKFGNNFVELSDSDFSDIVRLLHCKLDVIGINVSEKALKEAPVSAVHYSKNILLTDGSLPHHYINELYKTVKVPRNLDKGRGDYSNGGEQYKIHANSWELIVYDKKKDLERAGYSEKRAIEDWNHVQLSLLEPLEGITPLEIIRIELRINTRKLIRTLLNKAGVQKKPIFEAVYSEKLAKQALLDKLHKINTWTSLVCTYEGKDTKKLVAQLKATNPSITPKMLVQAVGLRFCIEDVGLIELANYFQKSQQRSWQRLIGDVGTLKPYNKQRAVDFLIAEVEVFKPVRVEDFENSFVKG